jgi:hypothetical protein
MGLSRFVKKNIARLNLYFLEGVFQRQDACLDSQKTGSRVKHTLARDDTVYSLVWSVRGFHLSTSLEQYQLPCFPVVPALQAVEIDPRGKPLPAEGNLLQTGA